MVDLTVAPRPGRDYQLALHAQDARVVLDVAVDLLAVAELPPAPARDLGAGSGWRFARDE